MAKIITFSLPDSEADLWDKFVALARAEGKTVSKLLAQLIKDYYEKHGEGNPHIPLTKWLEDQELVAFPTIGEKPDTSKLVRMPETMLYRLKQNAETYAATADYLLNKLIEHKQHQAAGYKLPECPYCQQD
jgi:hypothetical protein